MKGNKQVCECYGKTCLSMGFCSGCRVYIEKRVNSQCISRPGQQNSKKANPDDHTGVSYFLTLYLHSVSGIDQHLCEIHRHDLTMLTRVCFDMTPTLRAVAWILHVQLRTMTANMAVCHGQYGCSKADLIQEDSFNKSATHPSM